MTEVPDNSINLIVTSPPYYNIKDYSMDGKQIKKISQKKTEQIGDIQNYNDYILNLLQVWKECERILTPNGKLIVNAPLMPMIKGKFTSHYNRHIYNIAGDIENSIIKNTKLFLLDIYIWNRTNPSKKLMFGSYPYPRNFYAQNTIEFVTVYVKDGASQNNISPKNKEASKLTEKEWVQYTKQIWDIPIPNKKDIAFGKHCALMPEEIVKRCVKLFTYVGDTVLDPFTGSGTTLKVTKELGRNYVGYEISEQYKEIIEEKLMQTTIKAHYND